MQRLITAGLVILYMVTIVRADTVSELQERVEELEQENRQLRAQLAMAQMKIKKLEGQMEQMSPQEGESEEEAVEGDAGAYRVKITANEPYDTSAQQIELNRLRKRMPAMDEAITEAQERYDGMKKVNAYAEKWDDPIPHSNGDLAKARRAIDQEKREQRTANLRIARLEREIAEAKKRRKLRGELEDGTIVELILKQSISPTTLQVGQTFDVAGLRSGGRLIINSVSNVERTAPSL